MGVFGKEPGQLFTGPAGMGDKNGISVYTRGI